MHQHLVFNSLESSPNSGHDVYLREKSNPFCTRCVEATIFVDADCRCDQTYMQNDSSVVHIIIIAHHQWEEVHPSDQ